MRKEFRLQLNIGYSIYLLSKEKNFNYFISGFVEVSLDGIGNRSTWPGTLSAISEGK
jgi:hypothetical protein